MLQKAISACPAAHVASRRTAAASARPMAAKRALKSLRVQAQQEGNVGTVDGATAAEGLVPMADSLLERAKQVVDSQFVDEAFVETFVPELEAELAALQTRAADAEAEAGKLEEALQDTKDKFVRLQADFENFRKRTAAEKESLRASVRGDTVAALLPLVDNFELAKKQLKLETPGEERVDAAYQGLYKQMVELFRGLGLEATPGVGSPFDPNLHDGIMREASSEVPDGTILEEFRKGFTLGDKLLRAAMVKVSFDEGAPAAPPAADGGAAEQAAAESDAASSESA
ncbi:hypothetical protein D9Q98_001737 [Chlorella vulgaris]|uniref:GrpE protein homolog n=1 Tax=Chlorella vulgaris TaxID=3077 RepID=A0A9D4TVI4_CHLVU|nr:hypothetical protein D9Q98_001737 [Chlorella vulgaris]